MNFERLSTAGLTSTPNTSSDRISHPLLDLPSTPQSAASGTTSLLFIDTGVNDYQSLLAGVQPNTEVHVLDSSQDAITQITQTLTGRADLSSVHILSHGSTGSLKLGSDWLSSSDLERYSSQLQSWAQALTNNADILLYGCDVAAGEQGQAFVQQLAQLTGADVAASDGLTGNSLLGGNWNLEFNIGQIESPLAIADSAIAVYHSVLASQNDVIINEFSQGGSGAKEWVEILVVTDNLDLQNHRLTDGSNPNSLDIKLAGSGFASLKSGALIVLYNGGDVDSTITPDLVYNPTAGDYSLQISSLNSSGAFAISRATGWSNTTGAFANADAADVPKLVNTSSQVIATFPRTPTPAAAKASAYLGNTAAGASQAANWSSDIAASNATPGLGNNVENSAYITSLGNPNASLIARASSVTEKEDNAYSFQVSDFKFSTSSGQTLQQVQVTQLPVIGQLFLDADSNNTQDTGEAVTTNQIITLADIPKLKFQPVANANGSNYANFKFKASDGQVFSTTDATMTLNVNSVNDAPVLDTSGSPMLPSIYENASNSIGVSVSDLIGTSITDVDFGAVKAIALTGADNSNGKWQFSTNGGAIWTDLGNVSDTAATLLGATPLYTSALGNAPDQQSWFVYNNLKKNSSGVPPFVPGNASQTASVNGTLLNSTANLETYAGYSNYKINPDLSQSLKNPTFPVLDRAQGYSLSFNLQVLAESHTNPDRGVAVILLGDDNQGIELGVQFDGSNGRIFAQSLDANNQFVGAEAIAFNTNKLTDYTLKIQGTTYQLFANGTQVLTGGLRDYRAWTSPDGFPSPYGLKNFVFLGDSTTSAQSSILFNQVAIQTDTRVRFVPNADFVGNATFSFRAWDITNGAANGTTGINASLNGGISAFSSGVETAAIKVNSLPMLSINTVNQLEGNSESNIYTFTVTLSQASDQSVTVGYETVAATAAADADYTSISNGLLTFAPNELRKTIQVAVKGDTQIESDETFSINLFTATNAKIAVGVGTGTIVNDDESSTWEVVGNADFDGNGKADILRRDRATGANQIWQINGSNRTTTNLYTVSDSNWQVMGTADYSGDGKADILWRNISTGDNVFWTLNGGAHTTTRLATVADLNWEIKGSADYNGDGKADILWRNTTTGENVFWTLNGGRHTTTRLYNVIDFNWQIMGSADYDGDGKADILWRNISTGENNIWTLNGGRHTTTRLYNVIDFNWQIMGSADYNGDGKADILWRNISTGAINIWMLNGGLHTSVAFPEVNSTFQTKGYADYDGDGKADILWRNLSTNRDTIWKLNGNTYTATDLDP